MANLILMIVYWIKIANLHVNKINLIVIGKIICQFIQNKNNNNNNKEIVLK